MNAFIIGNGFDLAHSMPTSYNDFRSYLFKEYPDIDDSYLYIPVPEIDNHGNICIYEKDVASFLCYFMNDICGDDWSDFENALGSIDLLVCFEDLGEVYDRDGDRNLWYEAINNEDRTSDLKYLVPKIKEIFSRWIETIHIPIKRLDDFSRIIDPQKDLFISFNYSCVLEELYDCKNVIHMHGVAGGEIIVGHNGSLNFTESNWHVPNGCFDNLQHIYDVLRKNTEEVINRHIVELQDIANCSNIFSYGFSYSSVDIPYIKLICQLISGKNCQWIFNDYDSSERIDKYKSILRNYGFSGAFSTFRVKG